MKNSEILEQSPVIKKLLYRSTHRGCKETDLLLGRFFTEKFFEFSEGEISIYEKFIEEDDALIYDWIMGAEKTPDAYQQLIDQIRFFHEIYSEAT